MTSAEFITKFVCVVGLVVCGAGGFALANWFLLWCLEQTLRLAKLWPAFVEFAITRSRRKRVKS